jgi:hypothetical protein
MIEPEGFLMLPILGKDMGIVRDNDFYAYSIDDGDCRIEYSS